MDKKLTRKLCFMASCIGLYYLAAGIGQVYNMADHRSNYVPLRNAKMQANIDAEKARKENLEKDTERMERRLVSYRNK